MNGTAGKVWLVHLEFQGSQGQFQLEESCLGVDRFKIELREFEHMMRKEFLAERAVELSF